jgi:hypothetical protein
MFFKLHKKISLVLKNLLVAVVIAICCTSLFYNNNKVQAITIADLELTPANCEFIRNNQQLFGYVPCKCRLNTGNVQAYQCFPNCCPKNADFEGDRCHTENELEWTPYEQTICIERPPSEYLDDTPNCFDKGNNPVVTGATASSGKTTISFELSLRSDHKCDDLFVTTCDVGHTRPGMFGFRINTTDVPPKHCWLPCSPAPISACNSTSCIYNRGRTAPVVRDWTLSPQLVPGNYALVCKTLMQLVFDKNTLYQYAFAQTAFKIL